VSPLWTADEVARATRGRWLVKPPRGWSPTRVSYDVSALQPGNLVVCMTRLSWGGDRPDTSREMKKIVQSGAVGAIIQKEQRKSLPPTPPSFPLLLVDSTRDALTALCTAARDRFAGRVIALTGTVGKTTTRQMLLHVLDRQGGASATRGNNNNIAGVERSMAYTPREHGFSILEMGFGLPLGGVSVSSVRVRPHVALLTALGLAHLDVFGNRARDEATSLRLVAEQKLGILDGLVPDGTFVVHRDGPAFASITELAAGRAPRLVTFGESDHADARLLDVELAATRSRVRASIGGSTLEYELLLPGRHMAMNSVAALATVHAAGADPARAAADLADFEAVGGRAEIVAVTVDGGLAQLIDDSFNATPDSVRSTLRLLTLVPPGAGGRRIAVLGDILHLGPESARIHADLAQAAIEADVDTVFTIGNEMRYLFEALPAARRGTHAPDLAALYRELRSRLRPGDVLTVKASTPIGLTKITQALRKGRAGL
jgi:UDP-N-acetylmuramoyl-tripeptide--D-alanyl-D-alanine ligase